MNGDGPNVDEWSAVSLLLSRWEADHRPRPSRAIRWTCCRHWQGTISATGEPGTGLQSHTPGYERGPWVWPMKIRYRCGTCGRDVSLSYSRGLALLDALADAIEEDPSHPRRLTLELGSITGDTPG